MMKMGQAAEGRNLLRRSVDISHEMALELIKECQDINVDCIVAPYEADAQLAYLNMAGLADVVITEDSDLTLFGCKKIFFKMDLNGNGLLVEQSRLHLAMNIRQDFFDIEKFRHMCILSGCDYLASLPGIGLSKALKFVKQSESDIQKTLPRIGSYLNMKSLKVTNEYCEGFSRALVTFKYQLVYCPIKRKQVRLHEVPSEITEEQLHYAGSEVDETLAYQLALGNCHPLTLKKLHGFNPDSSVTPRKKTNSWHGTSRAKHHSIWSPDFLKLNTKTDKVPEKDNTTKWPNTIGKVMVLKTEGVKEKINPIKRSFDAMNNELNDDELMKLYGDKEDDKTIQEKVTEEKEKGNSATLSSPKRHNNPFSKKGTVEKSPCLVRGKKRKFLTNIAVQPTIINESIQTTSKFFTSNEKIGSSVSDEQTEESTLTSDKKIAGSVIISETQDEDLPISQPDEYKENAKKSNSFTISEEENHVLLRSDSGVDMKEDLNDKLNGLDEEKQDFHLNTAKDSNVDESSCVINSTCDVNDKQDEDETGLLSSQDVSEFAGNIQETNSLRSSFFKWSNPKSVNNTSIFNNKSPISSRKPVLSQSKLKTTKRPSVKKSTPLSSQQSLLNMFGFKQKPVMKR